ncbi:type IV toxin-antitoxin system AbiEi family antitoxin domain-containing protein [Actinotalea sp. C106]|uniref:type IV toxin-antitoxin system AbiEi family antitoxin domain-containing protein n=1 Tax=Actinotalea sp. C106 TaxID=2908644 RepID=UPI002027A307|nr:type IV toxin-antitoxin system AbiEi family antitoxin domain-containing protein [Actinotalea sp. C106]
MADIPGAVARLAGSQWGLLTTAQAARHGITRLHLTRLAARGVLERVDQGIYASVSTQDPRRDLRAAWLALAPHLTAEERLADPATTGVVSHTSAAELHHIGDLLADVPEVTVPARRQTRRAIRIHKAALDNADITVADGLPVTTVERTLADLLGDGHDLSHVADALAGALRSGSVDLATLARHLEPLTNRLGVNDGDSAVQRLLEVAELDTASLLRSPAAKELLAAGQISAITELAHVGLRVGDLVNPVDDVVAQIARNAAAAIKIDPLHETTQLIQGILDAQAAPLRDTLQGLTLSPALQGVIRNLNQPYVQEALRAANSWQAREARRLMNSPAWQAARRDAEQAAETMGTDQ